MIPEQTESCGSCVFYLGKYTASKTEPVGFCRRFPPVESDPLKAGIAAFAHPTVTESQWCGEYAAQEPTDSLDIDPSWFPKGRQQ
jgi:hypothetical protein